MINSELQICLIIFSYLLGSISTSIILCKIKKVDIRKIGSGNAGATNTVRALGKKYGAMVLILDILKGALPTMTAKLLSPESLILPICCAFASVAGHVFPIYFSFKGGKGAATIIGTIAIIFPLGSLICLLTWISVLILSGYVGLATIITAIIFPISILIFADINLIFFGITAMLFILGAHNNNIIRLIQGKENRFEKIHIFNPNSVFKKKSKYN
jgi:glycerol-3-phosphate acyltransferase PlsY